MIKRFVESSVTVQRKQGGSQLLLVAEIGKGDSYCASRRDCLFSVHLGMCRGRRLGVEGGGEGRRARFDSYKNL